VFSDQSLTIPNEERATNECNEEQSQAFRSLQVIRRVTVPPFGACRRRSATPCHFLSFKAFRFFFFFAFLFFYFILFLFSFQIQNHFLDFCVVLADLKSVSAGKLKRFDAIIVKVSTFNLKALEKQRQKKKETFGEIFVSGVGEDKRDRWRLVERGFG